MWNKFCTIKFYIRFVKSFPHYVIMVIASCIKNDVYFIIFYYYYDILMINKKIEYIV